MIRKTKFTPARKKIIYAGLRQNLTIGLVCQKAAISRKTFYRWIAFGKEGKKGYVKFLEECKIASADGASLAMDNIIEAMSKDWKAGAWILERRHGMTKEGKSLADELEEDVSKPTPVDETSPYREFRELSSANAEFDELEDMEDKELLYTIKNVYLSLNPRLQSEVSDVIGSINSSVIPFTK